jgi:pimeloyl-ACP methyl ester carboxylesterase
MQLRLLPLLAFTACGPTMEAQTVQVGSRNVSYARAGMGPVTVVFENGLHDSFNIWAKVFPAVSEVTQVFAYNRAGYPGSDAADPARDTTHIVAELHDTLQAVGLQPPYVMVGHSIGGLYAEGFTRLHPDEVAAWVSVEGRPADFLEQCMAQGVTDCDPPDSAFAGASAVEQGEWNGRDDAEKQVRAAPWIRGDLPLRVLTGTAMNRPEPADSLSIFQSLLARNAHESVNGELIEASQSGHYVHTQQPDLVIQAIKSVLP